MGSCKWLKALWTKLAYAFVEAMQYIGESCQEVAAGEPLDLPGRIRAYGWVVTHQDQLDEPITWLVPSEQAIAQEPDAERKAVLASCRARMLGTK